MNIRTFGKCYIIDFDGITKIVTREELLELRDLVIEMLEGEFDG
jgi:hypothetical protein